MTNKLNTLLYVTSVNDSRIYNTSDLKFDSSNPQQNFPPFNDNHLLGFKERKDWH